MPQPLTAGLPPSLQLPAGYVVRVTALDPVSGAAVGGVNVSSVAFQVRDAAAALDRGEAPMPLLVPVAA